MERRAFLTWVGVGCLASSLPVAIAACTRQPNASNSGPNSAATDAAVAPPFDPKPRPDGFQAAGTVSQLQANGYIEAKQLVIGPVILVAQADAPGGAIAIDPLCTHQGCSVAWQAADATFACPCHGSLFNADGTVATGPATAPLKTYEVQTEDDMILVKIS